MQDDISEVGFMREEIFDIFDLFHNETKLIVELFHAISVSSDIIIYGLEL